MLFLKNLQSRMERNSRYSKDRQALNNMSDRELADIGISRGDIDRITREK